MRVIKTLTPKIIYPMTMNTHYHAEIHNVAKIVIAFIRDNEKVDLRLNKLGKFLKKNNIQITLLQKLFIMCTFKTLLQNQNPMYQL